MGCDLSHAPQRICYMVMAFLWFTLLQRIWYMVLMFLWSHCFQKTINCATQFSFQPCDISAEFLCLVVPVTEEINVLTGLMVCQHQELDVQWTADILYAIREAGQEENSNCESATLNNLQEQKVKRGCGETTALCRQSKKNYKPTNWMLLASCLGTFQEEIWQLCTDVTVCSEDDLSANLVTN